MGIARILLVLLAIVATHFQISETSHVRQHDGKICQAQECKDAAEFIKSSMDSTVDPCDDFYDYACGGWMEKNPLPAGYSSYSTFNVLIDQNKKYLREILKEGISGDEVANKKLMRMPSDIYQSCMNSRAIKRVGDGPLKMFIRNIGGWSMGDESTNWDEEKWDFKEALKKIHKKYTSAGGPLFGVYVGTNPKDNDKNHIEIYQAGLSMGKKEIYTDKPETVEALKTYLIDVAKLLGGGDDTARKAEEVIDLEKELANVTLLQTEVKKTLFVTKTIRELKEEVPEFDLLEHLQAVLAPVKIDESEEIGVPGFDYFKKVFGIIKKTPKRVLNNYLVWMVIQDEMKYLTSAYRDAREKYKKKREGMTGTKERWMICVEYTEEFVGDLLGFGFIKKHFNGADKQRALDMIGNIFVTFQQNVDSLSWMDSKTKSAVAEKVDAMNPEIGFPSYYMNPQEFAEKFAKYNDVKIRNNKLYSNRMNLMKMEHVHMLQKLRKPTDKELWQMTPQTVNAQYARTENMLTFPAGILQPPFFFSDKVPRALSYGSMGVIIAHEMTHGFDDVGRQYNKDGEKLDTPWWSNSSIEEFKERTKCFINQYSNYKVAGKYPLNGELTLGENIADNGGFKAASKAYLSWLKNNGDRTVKLPGIDATDKQLFFLALGQSFCNNKTPELQYKNTVYDYHTESKFRVNGIFQNSHEFSDAFNCKKKTPMNPENKCVIWSKEGPLDI